MTTPQATRWLLDQLPELVAKGVLSTESADSLRLHYQAQAAPPAASSRSIAVVIFSILGGLLISAGIILLFAHNWDELGRPARTVLSFLPLLIGIALSSLSLLRQNQSVALAEGAGAFHALAVGACIALVGQTYQLSGDFPAFLLTWMLLVLPLVYLLRSTAVAIIYVAGISTWAGEEVSDRVTVFWLWPLLALVLPYYLQRIRENRFSGRTWWLSLALALAIPVNAGFQCDRLFFLFWPTVMAGVFTSLYLAGCCWFRKPEAPRIAHPFVFVGQAGILVLTIWLSWRGAWDRSWYRDFSEFTFRHWATAEAVAYGSCGLSLILLALGWMRKANANFTAGLLPLVVIGGSFLTRAGVNWTVLLMNLYTLVLGVVTIVRGIRDLRFASLNAGLLMIAALLVSRFFDSDIGFLVKGIAFIVVGAGFCLANVFLLKKRKAATI